MNSKVAGMTVESRQERRKGLLSDEDLGRIKGAMTESFEEQFTRWCETIGYDVTTPESRSAIRDDHRAVRLGRKLAVWFIGAVILAGIGAAMAGGH